MFIKIFMDRLLRWQKTEMTENDMGMDMMDMEPCTSLSIPCPESVKFRNVIYHELLLVRQGNYFYLLTPDHKLIGYLSNADFS